MELRAFVKTALLDIIGGIQDAQKETEEGTIVPTTNLSVNVVASGGTPVQAVDFQVSVTVEDSSGSEGKLGVMSSLVGAGIAGKSEKAESAATVIKFRIPLYLPTSGRIPK